MESLRYTQRKYCTRALIFCILFCLFFIAAEQIALGKGLLLGCLFSSLNFILIGETLPFNIGKSKRLSFIISLGSISIRYLLLSLPLIIAIKSDAFHLATVIIGLFAVQIVLFGDHVMTYFIVKYRSHI